MARIGFFPFLGRGHLNPFAALGRRLVSKGHSVVVFHLQMARPAIKRAGLEFCRIDKDDSPNAITTPTSRSQGPNWLGTRDVIHSQIARVIREGPASVRGSGIELMVIDQSDLAAGSVADSLDVPFVTIGCAAPLVMDPIVPLSYFSWGQAGDNLLTKTKTATANALVNLLVRPLISEINAFRKRKGLRSLSRLTEALSKHAIITQLPRFFDFPRRFYPQHLVYAGPFRDSQEDCVVPFPWQKLDGRPIIFASLGTVRNDNAEIFRVIANACINLPYQLVISLGGGSLLPEHLPDLAGKALIVEYAPQRELMKRAALVINCAGLNTTLDSMVAGVPLVAIPIAEDQPGVAARIESVGIGERVPFRRLTSMALKHAIDLVLRDPRYACRAQEIQQKLEQIDGVAIAVNRIEQVMKYGSSHDLGVLNVSAQCSDVV